MLLVKSKIGQCIVLCTDLVNAAQLARIEKYLGWSLDSVQFVAVEPTPVTFGDRTRTPLSMVAAIGPERIEQLEYQSYNFVRALQNLVTTEHQGACISTGYHDIASIYCRTSLRVYEIIATAPRRIFHVDEVVWSLLDKVMGKVSAVEILDLFAEIQKTELTMQSRSLGRVRALTQRSARVLLRIRGKRSTWRYWRDSFNLYMELIEKSRATHGNLLSYSFRHRRRIWSMITNPFDWPVLIRAPAYVANRLIERLGMPIAGTAMPPLKIRGVAAKRTFIGSNETEFDDVVLLTVADSGTRVNLDPALAILKEFKARGVATLTFTPSILVVDEVLKQQLGRAVLTDAHEWLGLPNPPPRLRITGFSGNFDPDVVVLLQGMLDRYWVYLSHRVHLYDHLLDCIASTCRILGVLSVNETLPVAVSAGQWARKRNRPWIGHFPVLLGKRPDCYYFPADHHLAYGEHLRDHMISAGAEPASIVVVGSQTYDRNYGQDRTLSRTNVETRLPRVQGKKLIIFATEYFPDPEIEFGPVMKSLMEVEGIHVVVKLHPDDSLDTFKALAIKYGVHDKVDLVKDYPLSELLGAADLLICVVSNIVIEAAVVGTPTLICDFVGRAKVINFADEGICISCSDPTQVAGIVRSALFDSKFAEYLKALMQIGVGRFNGPNDGRSSERIVELVSDRANIALMKTPENKKGEVENSGVGKSSEAQSIDRPLPVRLAGIQSTQFRAAHGADMCEYIFISSDVDDALKLAKQYAQQFLHTYGDDVAVVSFYQPTRTKLADQSWLKYWTDLFKIDDEKRLHTETVNRLDQLAERLGDFSMRVFSSHRIDLYEYMYRTVAFLEILNRTSGPICMMLQGSDATMPVVAILMPKSQGLPLMLTRPVQPRRLPGHAQQIMDLISGIKGRFASRPKNSAYLLALEDSGSMINIDPALAICRQLRANNRDPIVVTTSTTVEAKMIEAGVPVFCVNNRSLTVFEESLIHTELNAAMQRLQAAKGLDSGDRRFLSMIETSLPSWSRDDFLVNEELQKIDKKFQISALLTIGVASPLAILVAKYFQPKGISWLAYLAVLQKPSIDVVSSRHKLFYQQADKYLAYGDYLKDQLVELGIPEAIVGTVGSTTFDESLGRSYDVDSEHTRSQILKHWTPEREKLVVVGTESLQRPLDEIGPVLESLMGMEGVHTVIKVHPRDSYEFYCNYARSLNAGDRLEVVGSCDLNGLLHAADLLVCVFSNIIINAAVLGTPTLVVDFENKRTTLDFVAAGLCIGCFEPKRLPDILEQMLTSSPMRETAEKLLVQNIRQFNGLNDGQSAARVVRELVAASQDS